MKKLILIATIFAAFTMNSYAQNKNESNLEFIYGASAKAYCTSNQNHFAFLPGASLMAGYWWTNMGIESNWEHYFAKNDISRSLATVSYCLGEASKKNFYYFKVGGGVARVEDRIVRSFVKGYYDEVSFTGFEFHINLGMKMKFFFWELGTSSIANKSYNFGGWTLSTGFFLF